MFPWTDHTLLMTLRNKCVLQAEAFPSINAVSYYAANKNHIHHICGYKWWCLEEGKKTEVLQLLRDKKWQSHAYAGLQLISLGKTVFWPFWELEGFFQPLRIALIFWKAVNSDLKMKTDYQNSLSEAGRQGTRSSTWNHFFFPPFFVVCCFFISVQLLLCQ